MADADIRAAMPRAVHDAAGTLKLLEGRIEQYFATLQVRDHAVAYVRGLLAPVERKNCWQLAEQAGLAAPYDFQYLLGRARWNENGVRDAAQLFIGEALGWRGGILAIDETGFLKKGGKSAGVQRQYSGTAGRIENCQIGVFLSYHTERGHCLIDRELYLPEEWLADRERCREAGIPADSKFQTKPELAIAFLWRAFVAGYRPAWVTGDEVYGPSGDLRRDLEKRVQPYVLSVRANTYLEASQGQRVDAAVARLGPEAFTSITVGNGSKGPRVYDWTRVELGPTICGGLRRWLLVRRNQTTDERAFYLVGALPGTTLGQMAWAAAQRWPIEECFETTKQEVGLNEYEVRSYGGWYRHMTLALAAQSFLVKLRVDANVEETTPPKVQAGRGMLLFRHRQQHACVSASEKSGNF